jgi:hypothetical protein
LAFIHFVIRKKRAKDAHRGGEWGHIKHPLRKIFKKLVNKNAIKPKIWNPPGNFSPEMLDPQAKI